MGTVAVGPNYLALRRSKASFPAQRERNCRTASSSFSRTAAQRMLRLLFGASGFLLAELRVMRPIPLEILDCALLTRYRQSLTKETRIGAMPSFRYWVHSSVVPWRAH